MTRMTRTERTLNWSLRRILQMARGYSGAALVLVVDTDIQSLSSKAPAQDLVLSILTSSWMRRL
jgi:hypothetical protein